MDPDDDRPPAWHFLALAIIGALIFWFFYWVVTRTIGQWNEILFG